MTLTVELERAASSGERIAGIPELPGCMAVEAREDAAIAKVEALARMGKRTGLRPEDLCPTLIEASSSPRTRESPT